MQKRIEQKGDDIFAKLAKLDILSSLNDTRCFKSKQINLLKY